MQITNIAKDIAEAYAAGFAARLYQTSEPMNIVKGAEQAAADLAEHFDQEGVKVVCWNRFGFYVGEPLTAPKPDRTGRPMIGLNCMLLSASEIATTLPPDVTKVLKLPFNPEDDIIFVLHDFDGVMAEANGGNSELTTALRAYVQANMNAARDRRGKRMLLLVSVHNEISRFLPELTPVQIALPGDEVSEAAIDNVWSVAVDNNVADPLPETTRHQIIAALKGMPGKDREDAVSRAYQAQRSEIRKARTIANVPAFIRTIEQERARFLSGLPGVRYIDKHDLVTVNRMPGFEKVNEFMDTVLGVPHEKMKAHNLPGMRGIFLVGIPGTGKSEFSRTIALRASLPLVLLNLGEIQAGLVGASEANARSFINTTYQIPMVVMMDELDKMGMGSGGHGGDGGTWDRVQAIFLEAMADPRSLALWIAAANAVKTPDGRMLVKPELMRRGRFDEQYFVEVPDFPVRQAILKVHADLRRIKFASDEHVAQLAEVTENWVGAELADLIIRGTRKAVIMNQGTLPIDWMVQYAQSVTPLAKQAAFEGVLNATREECSQFTIIGRTNQVGSDGRAEVAKPARSGRAITLGSKK